MTRVTAMLAWFDEPEDLLEQAVAAAAVVADHVLAVDGGYRLRPGADSASPDEQAEAIEDAAELAGITCDVITPNKVWDGQVEKRNYMLQLASEYSDWVVPLDADWVFKGDPRSIRLEIEAASAAVLQVQMFTPFNGARALSDVASTDWHAARAGRTETVDILMRVVPGMRVEKHHWCYSGEWNGARHSLWGCEGTYPSASRQASQALTLEHRCFDRDMKRIAANREYCEARDAEVMMIGRET